MIVLSISSLERRSLLAFSSFRWFFMGLG